MCVSAGAALLMTVSCAKQEAVAEDSNSLFDGQSLNGWKAPDMSYWSVEEGAITAQSSEEHPCDHNQFLVWQGGDVANFDLKLKFKLEGSDKANSGVQVRSQIEPDGHVVGYQVDITPPEVDWLGSIYDEKGRKSLAIRGEKTLIKPDGSMEKEQLAEKDAAVASYKPGDWNEYHITFVGNELTVRLNGKVTAMVIDEQEEEREMSGVLALQLHSGPPMKVQFKDIELTKID